MNTSCADRLGPPTSVAVLELAGMSNVTCWAAQAATLMVTWPPLPMTGPPPLPVTGPPVTGARVMTPEQQPKAGTAMGPGLTRCLTG
jgi:hypothetical protein